MKNIRKRGIPVIMYHSVGKVHPEWIWNFLTVPYAIFEEQIETLFRKGFHTLDLNELYAYVNRGYNVPERSVVLTFDDGYLDNWVYVYPILKKYGFKGTIFVSPEFVDPCAFPRKNLEDVWKGTVAECELEPFGFLSWEEMRLMEESGVMDIQSHAMTHTWYFSEEVIVDFRHPGDPYIWMDWNDSPEDKYKYLGRHRIENEKYGVPVYKHQKSLEGRRIFPSNELEEMVSKYVAKHGGIKIFEHQNWRKKLTDESSRLKNKYNFNFKMETEEEFQERLKYEIVDSKKKIEQMLRKNVEYLCWPGGGICPEALKIASEVYSACTLPSMLKGNSKNRYGDNAKEIRRIGVPYVDEKHINYMGGLYLYYYLREYQGKRFYRGLRQAFKLFQLIKNNLSIKFRIFKGDG